MAVSRGSASISLINCGARSAEASAPAAVSDGSGSPPDHPKRAFYGRRKGHRLRDRRQALLETYLPKIGITRPAPGVALDPKSLFPDGTAEVWLEIGFGSGEHLIHQARAHPDTGFIGCEPYINGVASLVRAIDDEGLTNIRIYPEDARDLFDHLVEASIDRVYLLFPDPWHKARHHKRRFINVTNLDLFAGVMVDGAEFWFATDHGGYCRWTLGHFLRHPAFDWPAEEPQDWRRPPDVPATRYETKSAGAGRGSSYLRFCRLPRDASPGS